MTRDDVLREQEGKWREEVEKLRKLLSNAEVRLSYYHGQVEALHAVPHLEAAE